MLVFGGANMQNYSVESVLSPRNLDMLNLSKFYNIQKELQCSNKKNALSASHRPFFRVGVVVFFLKTKYNQTQPETSNGQKKHRSRENDGGNLYLEKMVS